MQKLMMVVGLFLFASILSDSARSATTDADGAKPEPYVPGMGDFMTAYVQPHHIKLWQAGNAGNWPLAAYESNELREVFQDVTTYQATWHDLPIAKMATTLVAPQLASVDLAIGLRDVANFNKAFEQLTAGCNDCHRAAKHEFIVIQVPSGNAFPDQVFAPR